VAYGCSRLPSPLSSLPCGDTKTPNRSFNTQLSSWGHSVPSQLGSPVPPSPPAPAWPPAPLVPLLPLLPPSPPAVLPPTLPPPTPDPPLPPAARSQPAGSSHAVNSVPQPDCPTLSASPVRP